MSQGRPEDESSGEAPREAEIAEKERGHACAKSASKSAYAPGTHLYCHALGYTHHGLATGQGTVIAHVTEKDSFWRLCEIAGDGICEVSEAEFADGRAICVKEHPHARFPGVEAVRRSRKRMRLSKLYGNDRYHLLFNNCEAFVTWCLEGLNDSQQVRNLLRQVPYLKVALMGDRLVREVSAVSAGNKSISRAIVDTISSPELNLGSWALDIARDQLNVPYADELNRGAARVKEDVTQVLESGERAFKKTLNELANRIDEGRSTLVDRFKSSGDKEESAGSGANKAEDGEVENLERNVQTTLRNLSKFFD